MKIPQKEREWIKMIANDYYPEKIVASLGNRTKPFDLNGRHRVVFVDAMIALYERMMSQMPESH